MVMFKNSKLRTAANANNLEKVKSLLAAGADPDAKDSHGDTVVRDALNNNAVKAACALIEGGADAAQRVRIQGTLLHLAVFRAAPDVARAILDRRPDAADALDDDGSNPLHGAASLGREPIARLLLERAPHLLEAKNRDGDTPLHLAAAAGQADIVALLLENGASPTIRNNSNRMPLFLAESKGQQASVEILRPVTPAMKFGAAAAAAADEEWKKLADTRIAHVMTEPEIGYRITEIFNFESRERLRIVHNLGTRADQMDSRSFDELPDGGPVEKARAALVERGGCVPEGFSTRLPKLPRPQGGA